MPKTDAQKRADYKYRKASVKRVPLDMKMDFYERIKNVAEALGVPVNTYIKEAISLRLEIDEQHSQK